MSTDSILALFSFAFAMSISPGPGNFMLLACGANHGFLRTLPTVLGISCGFLSMVFAVGMGLGQLLRANPAALGLLKLVCAAYVLWLAWKIARAGVVRPGEAAAAPVTFGQAALFQLVNPKAWTVALVVTVTFPDPAHYISSLLMTIGLFAVINIPAISVWALSGTALGTLLQDPLKVSVFNVSMAILLTVSMIPAMLGSFPV